MWANISCCQHWNQQSSSPMLQKQWTSGIFQFQLAFHDFALAKWHLLRTIIWVEHAGISCVAWSHTQIFFSFLLYQSVFYDILKCIDKLLYKGSMVLKCLFKRQSTELNSRADRFQRRHLSSAGQTASRLQPGGMGTTAFGDQATEMGHYFGVKTSFILWIFSLAWWGFSSSCTRKGVLSTLPPFSHSLHGCSIPTSLFPLSPFGLQKHFLNKSYSFIILPWDVFCLSDFYHYFSTNLSPSSTTN